MEGNTLELLAILIVASVFIIIIFIIVKSIFANTQRNRSDNEYKRPQPRSTRSNRITCPNCGSTDVRDAINGKRLICNACGRLFS